MIVKRYRPAFVSGYADEYAKVDNVQDLYEIPWIKSWSLNKNFYRFTKNGGLILAEMNQGRNWYVIASVQGNNNLDLIKRNYK